MAKQAPEPIPVTIFFRDTGTVLLDADCWQDEDGEWVFQSVEFPFLIASAAEEQTAVNQLVASAEEFFDQASSLDDPTEPELLAARELGVRLVEGYQEWERSKAHKKASIARIIGRARRERRGNWRVQSHATAGRSPQASRV